MEGESRRQRPGARRRAHPARLVLRRRPRGRARLDHRPRVFLADGRTRALALPGRAQARRSAGVRLEFRLRASAREVRQPLAAQALRLRHPRHRSPPAPSRLLPCDRARGFGDRAPLLQAIARRRSDRKLSPPPTRRARWGQPVNSLVPSGTAPHVPSGTASSCHRGPKSGEKASGSKRWRTRNFSNKESFGFLLTDAPNWGRTEGTPSDRLPTRDNSPRRALVRALAPAGRANGVSATLGDIAWSASGHSQPDYRPSACAKRLSIPASTQ